jgi:hypothetical protein
MHDLHIDDVVTLRKPHPCGSQQWRIYRTGADIGLICLGCQHHQLIPRSKLDKAIKKIERPHEKQPPS